jgi:hypothetical protein
MRLAQGLLQACIGIGIVVVAVDVLQLRGEAIEGDGIDATVLAKAAARTFAQLVEGHLAVGDADDRHAQVSRADQCLQRRKDHLVGEIAGRSKKDECIR